MAATTSFTTRRTPLCSLRSLASELSQAAADASAGAGLLSGSLATGGWSLPSSPSSKPVGDRGSLSGKLPRPLPWPARMLRATWSGATPCASGAADGALS